MMKGDTTFIYVGVGVFAFFGLLILLFSYSEFKSTYEFIQKAPLVDGKVLNLKERSYQYRTSRLSTEVHPTTTIDMTVEFIYQDKPYVIAESSYLLKWLHKEGDQVQVYLNEANPSESKINIFLSLWGAATGMGALGLMFCLGAFGLFKVFRSF